MGFNFFKAQPEVETDSWLDTIDSTPLDDALNSLPMDDVAEEEEDEESEFSEVEHLELPVDVYYHGDSLVIKTPVVGVDEDKIAITVNGQNLTIHKEAALAQSVKGADYIYEECHWGSLSRTIELPETINAEKAKAKIEHGVLTITLPRLESAQTKIIRIK